MSGLTEQARGWLSELHSVFEARRMYYTWAEVVGGYSTSGSEPVIVHLVIRFHPGEDPHKNFRRDYSHFTLLSQAVGVQVGQDLFESLAKSERVSVGIGFSPFQFG